MAVAQVPRFVRPIVHGPVIGLALDRDARVLQRVEDMLPVLLGVLRTLGDKVLEHPDDCGLA